MTTILLAAFLYRAALIHLPVPWWFRARERGISCEWLDEGGYSPFPPIEQWGLPAIYQDDPVSCHGALRSGWYMFSNYDRATFPELKDQYVLNTSGVRHD